MGQCVTVEAPNDTKNQHGKSIKNHQHGKNKQRVRGDSKPRKSGKKREESTDEETSEEEMLHGSADNPHANDPNFGKAQSPINLVTCPDTPFCVKPMSAEEFKENPLKFNYPDEIRGCTIINTGHTVQVNIPDHSRCTLERNGKVYALKQFHFHTPSEHTIDGKQYEMEMHLVHVNEEGEIAVLGFIFTTKQQYFQPTLKLTKSRRYLVKKSQRIIMNHNKQKVEDPINQQPDSSDLDTDDDYEDDAEAKKGGAAANELSPGDAADDRRRSSVKNLQKNDFLAQFWEFLPLKKTEEDVRIPNAISFDYLFETSAKTFKKSVETNEIQIDMEIFEYPGSLTTPPYTEGVSWMVSRVTHFINVKQLNKLSSCWGHHNNARDVQHYHGREVVMRNQSSMRGYFFQ